MKSTYHRLEDWIENVDPRWLLQCFRHNL